MKAIVCKSFGDLSQIVMEETAEPVCGSDQILIKVRIATVSFMDWLMTDGSYQLKSDLPYVPGTDGAGIVREVGINGPASNQGIVLPVAHGMVRMQNLWLHQKALVA